MKITTLEPSLTLPLEELVTPMLPPRERTLRYVGSVLRASNERIITAMEKLINKAPEEEIALLVTSPGGATGIAMNFYDSIRHILKPKLVSLASGEIDSS